MLRYFIFFCVIFISSSLWSADFGSPKFVHYDLEGDYRVTCIDQGLVEVEIHQCSGYLLEPTSWAYFFHQTQKTVSRVELSRVN